MVLVSMGSNISSQMRQPNAGRNGRSPGAVDSTTAIDRSSSSTPSIKVNDPLSLMRIGKGKPLPMNSSDMVPPLIVVVKSK
jgi:hypothetical protein